MRLRVVLGAALGLAAAARVAAGCGEQDSHPYVAELYEPDRDCLDTSTGIDVVEGASADSNCAPVCLYGSPDIIGLDDGGPEGGQTYVSTMCPPYPALFDTSGNAPYCAQALAALARADVCLDDGGSTSPADGAADVATDAPPDVTAEAAPDAPPDVAADAPEVGDAPDDAAGAD
jgi:hypothetical protein